MILISDEISDPWEQLKEKLIEDMFTFRVRNKQGEMNPFTIMKSALTQRDDPTKILVDDLTLLVISDVGTKSLPKDPFFIPIYGDMQEYFLNYLERFLFDIPRGCSFEEWKKCVAKADRSFAEKWGTEPCSKKTEMFKVCLEFKDLEDPNHPEESYYLCMMVFAYDMQDQLGVDLMRPVLELEVMKKGEPKIYLIYIDNIWEFYIRSKFTKRDQLDEGNILWRDGSSRSSYNLYT